MCSENKGVISFAVTAKLICVFVFAYAKKLFFLGRGSIIKLSRPVCALPGLKHEDCFSH